MAHTPSLNPKNKPHVKHTDEQHTAESSPKTSKCKFCQKIEATNAEINEHIETTHSREIIKELKTELDNLKETFKKHQNESPQQPLQNKPMDISWKTVPKAPKQPNK